MKVVEQHRPLWWNRPPSHQNHFETMLGSSQRGLTTLWDWLVPGRFKPLVVCTQKKFLAATFCAGEATSPKMEFTPTPTLFQLQDEPSIYGHFQWGKWQQVTINPWIWGYGIPLLFTLKQHFWLFIPPKKYWKRIKPLRNSRKSHSCWWNPSKKNPEKTCLAVTCYPLPILPIEIAAL